MLPFAPVRQKAPQPGAFLLFRFFNARPWFACFFLVSFLTLPRATAGAESVRTSIRHVLDGDSVILTDQRQVRLIGINAPEFGKEGQPDEPLAATARDRLRALTQGKSIDLLWEAEQRDHYGRWLAHLVLADGTRAEEVLLKEGLAAAIAIPPNVSQIHRHQAAELEARQARRGLWGHSYYLPIASESLSPAHQGFRFVRGRVTHVGRSKKYLYLDMGAHFALRITHADWKQYFQGRAEDWRGNLLIARGWISAQNGRLHMGIGHPAMLERLP